MKNPLPTFTSAPKSTKPPTAFLLSHCFTYCEQFSIRRKKTFKPPPRKRLNRSQHLFSEHVSRSKKYFNPRPNVGNLYLIFSPAQQEVLHGEQHGVQHGVQHGEQQLTVQLVVQSVPTNAHPL